MSQFLFPDVRCYDLVDVELVFVREYISAIYIIDYLHLALILKEYFKEHVKNDNVNNFAESFDFDISGPFVKE